MALEALASVVDLTATNLKLDAQNALLLQLVGLLGNTDQLEGLVGNTNTLLSTQAAYLDQVETLLTTLGTYEDGVEGLLSTLGVKNDTLLAKLEQLRVLQAAPVLAPLAAQESRVAADGANYYNATQTGAAITLSSLAAGIKTLELTAVGSAVWFRTGAAGITAPVPSADITTGTAPRYLAQGSTILLSVTGTAALALSGTGISLAWWLS